MIKNAQILVSGGAGFIGSHIADRLSVDNKVIVLDNLSSGFEANLEDFKNRITFIKGDILDRPLVEKLVANSDYIFHLAANVGNIKSIEDPYFDMEVNIKGTLNLLQASLNAKIKKFVYSSSSAAYGDAKYLPINESHPKNPESPYAVSKLSAEKYVLAFHIIYGIPVIALRYFNVYGPRQGSSQYANAIPVFFRNIKNGEPITIFGDGSQTRDFVNAKDVVNANILAAESELTTGVFNIATGMPTSVNELVDHIIDITASKPEQINAPRRKGEVLHSLADISTAKKMLGYKPEVTIKEGLRDYFNHSVEKRTAIM